MATRCGITLLAIGLVLGFSACGKKGGDGGVTSGSVSAPVEGKWNAINEDGQPPARKQTVTVKSDHILFETDGLSPAEGKANFSAEGDKIVADWYGSKVTFTLVDADTVLFEKAGVTWKLVRIK